VQITPFDPIFWQQIRREAKCCVMPSGMQDRERALRHTPGSQCCSFQIPPCSPARSETLLQRSLVQSCSQTAQPTLCLLFLEILSLILRGRIVHDGPSDLIAQEGQTAGIEKAGADGSALASSPRLRRRFSTGWKSPGAGQNLQASVTALL
jgi:hypothetical protein